MNETKLKKYFETVKLSPGSFLSLKQIQKDTNILMNKEGKDQVEKALNSSKWNKS